MTRKFFGTDGIRGRTNEGAITAAMALRIGQAAGTHFLRRNHHHHHRVVIGKDTRLSGYMMENAMAAGFTSVGMEVILVGALPTPAIAILTKEMRADLGVMISASHNKYMDNGIKLFGPDGFKLSDADELAIEALLEDTPTLASPESIGRVKRYESAQGRYIHFIKSTFPERLTLDGLKIVVDCANGASHRVASTAFWELSAEVVSIGVQPNGMNINESCGSTEPAALQEKVREEGANLGIALDGDADRVVLVDEKGSIVDGDQLIALITNRWIRDNKLKGGGIVATVMSNFGLERYLTSKNLKMERTGVGDRLVLAKMRAKGYNVGGENSGHIILTDYGTTGDGMIAAFQVLAELVTTQRPASELFSIFDPVPQVHKDFRFEGPSPLENARVQQAIRDGKARLEGKGSLLVRKSGTEPVVRITAQGDDDTVIAEVAESVIEAVKAA